jgi:hypothetical protein
MIVLNLSCANRHRFEGWFASHDDYLRQTHQNRVLCPVCGDHGITRLPSNPRVRRSSRAAPGDQRTVAVKDGSGSAALRAMLTLMQSILSNSEDVGERFPEEARRIHYEETPMRSIRGMATREETEELLEEGIMVLPLPIPPARNMH